MSANHPVVLIDPYATHIVALMETALTTTGGILELGCGHYSTPMLAAIAKLQGRRFLAQASNKEWAAQFPGVEIVEWKTWSPPEGPWGMVFMDNEEHTRTRYQRLPALAEVTDTIVLHDANEPDKYNILQGWETTLHTTYKPFTAVLRRAP